MYRGKCASFDHIVGAPEEGEREADTERLAADGKRHADRFEEFKRLSRLNENIGKTDQEIWEMVA
jgi:hypothetical protein